MGSRLQDCGANMSALLMDWTLSNSGSGPCHCPSAASLEPTQDSWDTHTPRLLFDVGLIGVGWGPLIMADSMFRSGCRMLIGCFSQLISSIEYGTQDRSAWKILSVFLSKQRNSLNRCFPLLKWWQNPFRKGQLAAVSFANMNVHKFFSQPL